MKVLFIGFVWPEPRSSAAGLRTCSLIRAFQEVHWEVHFATAAKQGEASESLQAQKIPVHFISPNDPTFDSWIAELKPDIVIFDRFIIEEQFGWRVREHSPHSLRVVDTVDLHFLRRARHEAIKQGLSLTDIAQCRFDLITSDALREIASIYRSDCTLVISNFEMALLTDPQGAFRIPPALVQEFSFCYSPPPPPEPEEMRSDFVVIGNFRHEPNADGVRWLKREIWPMIRNLLPQAKVHIYGAYPSREMMDLTNEREGFHVRGAAENQYETLKQHRINLAPLRFGAGLKGKISDGWWCGIPCVTTAVGAEGMGLKGQFGGLIADTAEAFARDATALYQDSNARMRTRDTGYLILQERFDHDRNARQLIEHLEKTLSKLPELRAENLIGKILAHHFHQGTKYFSRWIELKSSLL